MTGFRMHYTFTLTNFLSLALLWSAVCAAPSRLPGRSFKVERRQQIQTSSSRNGPSELAKAYRKFGWSVPSQITVPNNKFANGTAPKVLAAGDSGDVQSTPQEGDAEFLSPIEIGGQTLMMNFDTGSSDLWVFNPQLSSSLINGHTSYDPAKSKTFKKLEGASFKITYGDNSGAEGNVGTDTVNVGGATVTSQAIELATSVTQSFVQDAKSDGLIGLAFSSINTVEPEKQKTFFDNVQQSLDQPVFTANLKHATVGAYEFGRIDKSQFKGQLAFADVDSSQGFWQFSSNSFAVGDGPTSTNQNASPAIADTGTSLMLVDDAVNQAYWSQVEGAQSNQQGVVFPCDADLPDFHVSLGQNNMATIPGALMNFSPVGGGSNLCFGGLQSNLGQPIQIYGDVMFKSQFVVFDGGNKRIGFAPHL